MLYILITRFPPPPDPKFIAVGVVSPAESIVKFPISKVFTSKFAVSGLIDPPDGAVFVIVNAPPESGCHTEMPVPATICVSTALGRSTKLRLPLPSVCNIFPLAGAVLGKVSV